MLTRKIVPEPWHQRTMSYMYSEELEKAEKDLRSLQPLHLFGGCRERDLETLWENSYYAAEYPYAPKPQHASELEEEVLRRIGFEVQLLSPGEYGLLHRFFSQKGSIILLSGAEVFPGLSFIRRLWAYRVPTKDGSIRLTMPDPILFELFEETNVVQFVRYSMKLSEFVQKTSLILLVKGILPLNLALDALAQVPAPGPVGDMDLAMRFMKAAFRCRLVHGQMVLLHNAVYDPEPFAASLANYPTDVYSMEPDNTIVPFEHFDYLLETFGTLIPRSAVSDLSPEELVSDLVLLCCQNAPFEGLLEVLRHSIIVEPTQPMVDFLHLLKSLVPVWPVFRSEVLS